MTQAIFVHDGDTIDYTPGSNVTAGDVVVQGDLVGVAKLDIASEALGALAVEGVFDIAKVTGAIAAGAKLYWDADGNPLGGTAGTGAATTTAAGNSYMGQVVKAAAETDTVVRVRLEQDSAAVAANQADSEASTIAALVIDFNALLAKLQAAGLMASA